MLAMAITLAIAWVASAEEFGVRTRSVGNSFITIVEFTESQSDNDYSAAIQACPTMYVTFDESSTVEVEMFSTNRSDNTLAEITAAISLVVFTADTSTPVIINPGTQQIRFVVNDNEASGTSYAEVWCITQQARADEIIMQAQFEGSASTDGAYSSSKCVNIRQAASSSGGTWVAGAACDEQQRHGVWSKDLVVTRVALIGTHDLGRDIQTNAQEGSSGCAFQFVTLIDSTSSTDIGSEIVYPEAPLITKAIGEITEHLFPTGGFLIPKGQELGLKVRDGDFCEDGSGAGTTCFCGTSSGVFGFEAWGYFR